MEYDTKGIEYEYDSPEYHIYDLKHKVTKYGKTSEAYRDGNGELHGVKWFRCKCGREWKD